MAIQKSTKIEDYRMIHIWEDPDTGYRARVFKSDGWWVVDNGIGNVRSVQWYQRAVDIVMDEWRLDKAGYETWEEAAAEMAEAAWDTLSDEEMHDLIDAARQDLRRRDL